MPKTKKQQETQAFLDEFERKAKEYANQLPGAWCTEHRKLRVNCIIDLALEFIHQRLRAGKWQSTQAAWLCIKEAANFISVLDGKSGSAGQFSMIIQGLDPSNLIIQKADDGTTEE